MNGLTRIEQDSMNAVISINRKMKDQREIDWEARRYEIAKDIMMALISNPISLQADVDKFSPKSSTDLELLSKIAKANAYESVVFADALINELKGGSK